MIRKVTKRNYLEQIHELGSYAFNLSHSNETREIYLKRNECVNNYIDEVDGQVISQMVSLPFQVTINHRVMKMAGIGDVATYPEARGTGSIRLLFETIFNDLHENKTEVSYLAPFSQPFYRKFGYENVFDYEETRIPAEIMRQIKPEKSGRIERVLWQDKLAQETIKKLYKETLETHNGSLVREDFWWDFTLNFNEGRKLAIAYDENNQACGYLIYGLIGTAEFMIYEMSFTTLFGLKKLMTFVSSHSGSFSEFVSTNITDSRIIALFPDTKAITRKTHSHMMARIVNFKEFIEAFSFKESLLEKIVFLRVEDTNCSWNNGVFKLTINQGRATCEKIETNDLVDFSGTIQRWTQVFLGKQTLEQAIWMEQIHSTSEKTDFLTSFKLNTPHLYDYF
ncbi:GNAT family N-acetyltransferase [Vagococcus sp.]|uniref:GNAT family N-acetyltransferase n=1 Tax=Vagococcus sp. TaxID=1933889 RepID=UPI002FC9C57F